MNWFTKQVPTSALIHRLQNQEANAAVEYLIAYTKNAPIDRDRLLQALTLLALECRDWPQLSKQGEA